MGEQGEHLCDRNNRPSRASIDRVLAGVTEHCHAPTIIPPFKKWCPQRFYAKTTPKSFPTSGGVTRPRTVSFPMAYTRHQAAGASLHPSRRPRIGWSCSETDEISSLLTLKCCLVSVSCRGVSTSLGASVMA